jgi:hypothetical protein
VKTFSHRFISVDKKDKKETSKSFKQKPGTRPWRYDLKARRGKNSSMSKSQQITNMAHTCYRNIPIR